MLAFASVLIFLVLHTGNIANTQLSALVTTPLSVVFYVLAAYILSRYAMPELKEYDHEFKTLSSLVFVASVQFVFTCLVISLYFGDSPIGKSSTWYFSEGLGFLAPVCPMSFLFLFDKVEIKRSFSDYQLL